MIVLCMLFLWVSTAMAAQPLEIHVSEHGYFSSSGEQVTHLEVPGGVPLTIQFVFDEDLTSLAIGDVHQFRVITKHWEQTSEEIWIMSPETTITFTPKQGTEYRIDCIRACIGMDHLLDLRLKGV